MDLLDIARLLGGMAFGFVIPGFLVAKLLGCREDILPTFIVSPVILFHVILVIQTFGVPVTFTSVFAGLAAVSLPLAWLAFRERGRRCAAVSPFEPGIQLKELPWLIPVAVSAAILAVRTYTQPFGYAPGDQLFRWDFLAVKIFETGDFSFYPPVTAEDYRVYMYPDGLPPMVSFVYFWVYESFGSCAPSLILFPLMLQYCLLLLACRRMASLLSGGADAGLFGMLVLSSSTLFFCAVASGQESGLLALSLSGIFRFVMECGDGRDPGPPMLAGFAAALGALSREYGPALIFCGLAAAIWKGLSMRQILIYMATSLAFSSAWYVRTWALAGNPLYSHDILGLFHVNPVHVGILKAYAESLSLRTDTAVKLGQIAVSLLCTAPLSVIVGGAAAIIHFRRHGYMLAGCLVIALLCMYSIGYTPGGIFHSMRVLAPALPPLSALAGCLIAEFAAGRLRRTAACAALFSAASAACVQDLIVPFAVTKLPLKDWYYAGFSGRYDFSGEILGYNEILPEGSALITDNPVFNTVLSGTPGARIRPVVVWSPELGFMFDERLSGDEVRAELVRRNLRYICLRRDSLNYNYYGRFAFFRDLEIHCRKLAGNLYEVGGVEKDGTQ